MQKKQIPKESKNRTTDSTDFPSSKKIPRQNLKNKFTGDCSSFKKQIEAKRKMYLHLDLNNYKTDC